MGIRSRSVFRIGSMLVIIAVAILIALLALVQRGDDTDAWIELTRYLPYYWLLVPCVAAFALACVLGRCWMLVSLMAPALLATASMGLEWNEGESGTQRVRLMTYNAKLHGGNHTPLNLKAVALEVERHDPDILVMQDVDGFLVERTSPPSIGGPAIFGLANVYALGQYVVASRLPLSGCAPGQIGYGNESHRFLHCTIDAHGTPLSVVTAHFRSPRMGLVATRQAGFGGLDEWRQNFHERMTQARALARQLEGMPRPLIVAGDLNAPESSPVIRALLAAGLRDTFSVAGRGFGYSYGESMRAGLPFLRIDHILASPDIGIAANFVGERGPSEHRPVIADLVLRR